MAYFSKRERIIIFILILAIVIISLFSFMNKKLLSNELGLLDDDLNEMSLETEEVYEEQIIMVHISGQVYRPGLVELELGSRVVDAVNLAGGLKKDADLDKINLAKKLSDEEKIYIPIKGEEVFLTEVSTITQSNNDSNKININKATREEIMSLPGIGEVLAGRILEYRENTPFKAIEDIKNVSGIGDKKFENMKEFITVD